MTSGGCRKHEGGKIHKLHPKIYHLVHEKWKGQVRQYVFYVSEITSISWRVFGPNPKEMKFQIEIVD